MLAWKRVDVSGGKAFEKDLASNLKIYERYIKERHSMPTYHSCVDDAIKSGNHIMFADRFLASVRKHGYESNGYAELVELADKKVAVYIAQCEKELKNALPAEKAAIESRMKNAVLRLNLKELPLVNKTLWRSPRYSLPPQGSSIIGKQSTRIEGLYSKEAKEKWENENTAIPRDVLVMHALLLGLSSDETDELLNIAGYPFLYPLDAIDACEIIYLNMFCGDLGRPPYEVLEIVKIAINRISKDLESKTYIYAKSGKTKGAYKGILVRGAGRDIDNELKSLKDSFQQMAEDKKLGEFWRKTDGLTRFLTNYYDEKIQAAISAGGDYSKERMEADDILIQRYYEKADGYFYENGMEAGDIFTQRYYGFLKKTKDYLYDWKRYYKNLEQCSWKLTPSFRDHDFIGDPRGKTDSLTLDKGIVKVLRKVKKAAIDSDVYYKGCLDLIQYARTIDSLVFDESIGLLNVNKNNRFTYINRLLEGDQVKYERPSEKDPGVMESAVGYAYKMDKKKDVIRFALSAGREEEIGDYLMLARYWKKNWYRIVADSKKPESTQGSDAADNKETDILQEYKFHPDPVDDLLIYALLYRDKLIDTWCEGVVNSSELGNKIRDMFPMRELLLEISYDISFIYLYGVHKVHDKTKTKEEINESYDKFRRLRHMMIFPVQWYDADGKIKTYNRNEDKYQTGRKA